MPIFPYQRWTEGALAVVLYIYLMRRAKGEEINRLGLSGEIATILDFRKDSIQKVLISFWQLEHAGQGKEVPYPYLSRSRIVEDVWNHYAGDTEALHQVAVDYLVAHPEAMLRNERG